MTPILLTPGPHDEFLPSWSPDGALIAFVTRRGTDADRHAGAPLHRRQKRLDRVISVALHDFYRAIAGELARTSSPRGQVHCSEPSAIASSASSPFRTDFAPAREPRFSASSTLASSRS